MVTKGKTLVYGLSLLLALFVIQTGSAAEKVSIGIGNIKSTIHGADPKNFQTMLETQLTKTNKFVVIERGRIDEILKEQGLASTEFIEGGASFGGIQGVDYLFYGSITKLGADKDGISVGGFSAGSAHSAMAVDLRVVDAHTGEIILADSVERSIKSSGKLRVEGFSHRGSSGDPLADVQRLTAEGITGLIVTTIYPVKIIAIQGNGTIILNYGKGLLSKGDVLRVFEVGEGFVDPDTGEVLGKEEIPKGLIEITETQAKFSKAKVLEGSGFQKGYIARKTIPSEDPKEEKRGFLPF